MGETIAQYAKKGSGVLVSGRLNQRSWEDKQGNKRSSVEIVVEDFNFMGAPAGSRDGATYSSPSYNAAAAEEAPVPDDIPNEIDLTEVPF